MYYFVPSLVNHVTDERRKRKEEAAKKEEEAKARATAGKCQIVLSV